MVLRAVSPLALHGQMADLEALGVRHIEIAWQSGEAWIRECRELIACFPGLRLGAASVCSPEGLEAARAAGFGYAVSPVLDPQLCRQAGPDLVLVPGVMSPTEVCQARALGCRLVKLFPAATVGPGYWRRLAAPLGEPLPFCIAAGGLGPADVMTWLEAGVDAVALGSSLTAAASTRSVPSADPGQPAPARHAALGTILASLSR